MRFESTFTTDGNRNWKQVTEMNRSFFKHAVSKEHLTCYSTWKEKIKRSEMGEEITSLINTEPIEKNRYYFPTLIDIAAAHELVFRKKIDAFESEDEGGNGLFLNLFNYSVEKD